jgi:hypothetical protein
MVYKENIVVALKVNGKILGERGEYITLPFGSEYTILIKNLNSKKALIQIDVDGEDVLDGDSLIVPANSDIELEGFKKGNKITNRFKFIKKTEKISKHRGDRIDDGLIRVEATFEKRRAYDIEDLINRLELPEQKTVVEKHYHYPNSPNPYWYYPTYHTDSRWTYTSDSHTFTNSFDNSGVAATMRCFAVSADKIYSGTISADDIAEDSVQDNGITVKGNTDSKQSFIRGSINTLEQSSHVIILRLRGTDSKKQEIKKPVFTKTKTKCETCGKVSKFNAKFCSNCGTCLE